MLHSPHCQTTCKPSAPQVVVNLQCRACAVVHVDRQDVSYTSMVSWRPSRRLKAFPVLCALAYASAEFLCKGDRRRLPLPIAMLDILSRAWALEWRPGIAARKSRWPREVPARPQERRSSRAGRQCPRGDGAWPRPRDPCSSRRARQSWLGPPPPAPSPVQGRRRAVSHLYHCTGLKLPVKF